MVRIHPDPPDAGIGYQASGISKLKTGIAKRCVNELIPDKGAVAQLGERLLCKQEAVGSIPSSSTSSRDQKTGIRNQHGASGFAFH